jgi:peptidoglycan/xylan/chitin deacetylase (PgdA/CDA1 family)
MGFELNKMSKKISGFILFFSFITVTSAAPNEVRNNNEYPMGYYFDDPLPDHTVYLTFDDGPTDWTDEILDTLRENNIKATFFICSNWQPKSTLQKNSFLKYKITLERMVAEGHVLGNHTVSHFNLAALSAQKIEKQFDLNQELLNDALGQKAPLMTLIRPPFGHPWSVKVKPDERIRLANVIKTRGLVMMWSKYFNSKDSKEWVKGEWYERGDKIDVDKKEFKKKMNDMYAGLVNNSKGRGMVILFHDTHLTTVKILPGLIKKLVSLGYHFATLEEYVQWRWKTGSRELVILNNTKDKPEKNKK